jgi:hypothetical protein
MDAVQEKTEAVMSLFQTRMTTDITAFLQAERREEEWFDDEQRSG